MKVNNKFLGLGIGLTLGLTTLVGVIALGTDNNNGLSKDYTLYVTRKQINSEIEEVLKENFYNAKVINNENNIIVTVADYYDLIEDDRLQLDDLAETIKNHYKDYGYDDSQVTVILLNTSSDVMGYAKE